MALAGVVTQISCMGSSGLRESEMLSTRIPSQVRIIVPVVPLRSVADAVIVTVPASCQETRPVLDFYKDTGLLYTVDGIGSTEEIYSRVSDLISGLD